MSKLVRDGVLEQQLSYRCFPAGAVVSGWAQQFGRVVIDLGSGQCCGFVLGERQHFLLHTSICREIRIHCVGDRSLEHDGTLLEPQSLCHFAFEVAFGCAQFCCWFCRDCCCDVTFHVLRHDTYGVLPGSFSVSLCVVSVVGHLSSEPASLLKMVFCSLLPGVVILTFKSVIEDRCEGLGKEKWCTQGCKSVLYPKRKFHFLQASLFSTQVCVLHIWHQVAWKLGAAACAATALCLSHLFLVDLVRCLEYFGAPLAAAISMREASAAAFKNVRVRCCDGVVASGSTSCSGNFLSQASAAAFKSGIELVRRFLHVCEEFCASVGELLLSAYSAAELFVVWLSTTPSPRRGPREAWQAQATPRVDVADVTVEPSSQQVMSEKSCFDQFPPSFGECTPGSLVTPLSGLSFLLVTLSVDDE